MFSLFKKKEKVQARVVLINLLNDDALHANDVTKMYHIALGDILRESKNYEDIEKNRNYLFNDVYQTKHGKEWFKKTCLDVMKMAEGLEDVQTVADKLDAFLGAYWLYIRMYPNEMEDFTRVLEKQMPANVRRFYEKKFNIDVMTGTVYDKEIEEMNVYKEHFYRASYAYNQGNGDLELSMKEWRYFLQELAHTLENRPRVIYDFAREVCEHQKLFMFVVYAMKTEYYQKTHNPSATNEVVDGLLRKLLNAIYAINEEYGIFLKRYYA